MKMGVVNATKAAKPPIEKIAPMASSPPKIKRRRQQPIVLLNHTALTGVWVYLLTCFQMFENGKQLSRAYANVTREAAIMQP